MIWTKEAEEALIAAKSDKKIMQNTNQRFLNLLTTLIEQTTHDLTKFDRIKFETLVTIHVHQRDIFDQLTKWHIKSPLDFEWLKQARFYFDTDANNGLGRCIGRSELRNTTLRNTALRNTTLRNTTLRNANL